MVLKQLESGVVTTADINREPKQLLRRRLAARLPLHPLLQVVAVDATLAVLPCLNHAIIATAST